MKRIQDISAALDQHQTYLQSFGVIELSLFGSTARGEAGAESDMDFLVELQPKTFRNYMGLKLFLEDLFGCSVDLVTKEGLKPLLRDKVLSEARRVA